MPRRTDDLRIRAKRLFDALKAERVDGLPLLSREDGKLMDEILEALEPGAGPREELVEFLRRVEGRVEGLENVYVALEPRVEALERLSHRCETI